MAPIRFITTTAWSVNRRRKWPAVIASTSHQIIDPQKIPSTRNSVSVHGLGWPSRNAASTAMYDSTVVGFVRVSSSVVAYAEWVDSSRASFNEWGSLNQY